ncbi:PAS domain S-box protein [Pedobacter sp. N36a]|uniref:PAS domain S-box protein n=1 Tax=Pedobacter sp. N36a TaxID=2767996 RepID=UPI0016575529|nr:PAS domain S-box protein [Pedobacter sp. N36a]MBC8988470.1 PAS domain S-box protein [Pedobacter sp. N36a]
MDSHEKKRIETVNKYFDIDFDGFEFQELVDLAAKLCDKPVALITLLDGDSNWMKVRFGTEIQQMPRETSFCQYSIAQDELLIVPDATKDPRFKNNPLVKSDPNLKFYAGAPLTLDNGFKIGTLCLFDTKPNNLTDTQKKILSILSRHATSIMQAKLNSLHLQEQIRATEAKNDALIKIAQLQSHQIRQPLTTIMGLVNLVKQGYHESDAEWIGMLSKATEDFDKIIVDIVSNSIGSKDLASIRYNKMVEEIDDYAIVLMDREGNVENWNKGAQKIKGYLSSEIIGKNFGIFYTEADRAANRHIQLLSEAASKGVSRDRGWRVRKDGSRFFAIVVITAIHDDMTEVIGFTKVTRDLTEIREAQDGLRLLADMHELLVEQAGEQFGIGGWQLDLERQSLSWTSTTRKIHGVDDEYVPQLSTAIDFYRQGSDRAKMEVAIKSAISDGKPWDLNLHLTNMQGMEVRVRAIGRSNFDGSGCTMVYGTIQKLT